LPAAGGDIEPFYTRQALQGSKWQKDGLGWCGTGAGKMVVPPGRAGRFNISASDAKTFRVGIHCQWTHLTDGPQDGVIWSEPIQQ
jgi:hypothetical protein